MQVPTATDLRTSRTGKFSKGFRACEVSGTVGVDTSTSIMISSALIP